MPVAPTNSIVIEQTPASASLAQSPILFSVKESSTGAFTSSSFQYISELYYWTGSESNSGSADYTLQKYPGVLYFIDPNYSEGVKESITETDESEFNFKVGFKSNYAVEQGLDVPQNHKYHRHRNRYIRS